MLRKPTTAHDRNNSPSNSAREGGFWYADFDTPWLEAGCLNNKLPLPIIDLKDRPNYSTQLECCKAAYAWQMPGVCLSQLLPSPPTTSATGSGGVATFLYPDNSSTSWTEATITTIQAPVQRRLEKLGKERKQRRIPRKPRMGLTNFMDPKSVTLRVPKNVEERTQLLALVEETQQTFMQMADVAVADGANAFRVVYTQNEEGAFFTPSEILIEVLKPNPECRYSVTVTSHNRYTGTAMLISETDTLVYLWKPIFPGQYEVLVHEINKSYGDATPLIQPPYPIFINEGPQAGGAGLSMLEDRIQNMPPCQTVQDRTNIYSHWDGDWIGPDFQLTESLRTGWSFLPSSETMNCKLETFDNQAIRSIPEKTSIYIVGRSVERGIFLSLVDMMLDKMEKKMLKKSIIGKCWGRASVTKGNLQVMYQDFRVNAFEDPTEPQFIECHNDKLVKERGSSFIQNATLVWEEIFQQEEVNWPSVIFLVTGLGAAKFKFEHHVQPFVSMLPPNWHGTLFLGDFEFSARGGGLGSMSQYEIYLKQINTMVNALNDPRVRWIDGTGISKEMRMYAQKGEEYVARSQHFHHPCLRKDPDNPKLTAMVVCSNVTEMVGQLLLGHALGPKAEFMERVKQNPTPPDSAVTWCTACPKCMIPFHITPYPKMTCVDGPIVAKTEFDDCSVVRSETVNGGGKAKDPSLCPDSCLESPAMSEFGSETDTVYVRQCPI